MGFSNGFQKVTVIGLLAGVVSAFPAQAQSGNAALTNSSTVLSSCTISVIDNINMGAVNPLQTTTAEDTGTIRLVCSKGTYTVNINSGTNPIQENVGYAPQGGGMYRKTYSCQRRLTRTGGQTMPYNLYMANNTSVSNTKIVTSTEDSYNSAYCKSEQSLFTTATFTIATGPVQDITLIARTFPTSNKGAPTGVYTDTLVFSVIF